MYTVLYSFSKLAMNTWIFLIVCTKFSFPVARNIERRNCLVCVAASDWVCQSNSQKTEMNPLKIKTDFQTSWQLHPRPDLRRRNPSTPPLKCRELTGELFRRPTMSRKIRRRPPRTTKSLRGISTTPWRNFITSSRRWFRITTGWTEVTPTAKVVQVRVTTTKSFPPLSIRRQYDLRI